MGIEGTIYTQCPQEASVSYKNILLYQEHSNLASDGIE